jgi:hypothetical protein
LPFTDADADMLMRMWQRVDKRKLEGNDLLNASDMIQTMGEWMKGFDD